MEIPREELLATRYERIFAYFLDLVILAAVGAVLVIVLRVLGLPDVGAIAATVALGLLWWPAFAGRAGERNGQTPAKQLLGLRTMQLSGEPFSFGQAFVREGLLKYLLGDLTAQLFLVVSWLFSLGRDDHRALHDRIAGTVVVCDEKRWIAPPDDWVRPLPAPTAGRAGAASAP